MTRKKPEVLAPAGDRERLEAALRFGADAVYLGGKAFQMRANTKSFTQEQLADAVRLAHGMGRRVYLTCNTLLTNEECANALDLGNFYRVPCDKRDLNYDKYFREGNVERNVLTEFNSNNTRLLDVAEVQEKLLSLAYIREELAGWKRG